MKQSRLTRTFESKSQLLKNSLMYQEYIQFKTFIQNMLYTRSLEQRN